MKGHGLSQRKFETTKYAISSRSIGYFSSVSWVLISSSYNYELRNWSFSHALPIYDFD